MKQRTHDALAALVVLLSPLALACTGEARSASPQQAGAPMGGPVPVAEFRVDTATVRLPLELPAQLYVEHDAVVVARSAGTIDGLYAELGDRVQPGQLLARLESADQSIALAGAEAAFESMTRTAARTRLLKKGGGATAADSEQVEFQLRQADVQRRKAQRDIELTRVAAPFAGTVTARLARPRRFVAVGDTLFRVTESSPLFARVRVPESGARQLRVGDSATVSAGTGFDYRARIVHAAPFIDAASGTREVVLELVRPGGALLAGSSVTVRLGHEPRSVVTAPRAAIAPDGYAVVVDNGRSMLRPVTVGRDVGDGRVEVLSGLAAGERLARPTH
ncbi:MAG TPA: efflux RND transporter periplasmic adaptor subunit [Gemmatimonadaceae bacterium]|nr:efflux RND transporter periplasmic adaptor subunit [Gemmatimonadaceae bacterium]